MDHLEPPVVAAFDLDGTLTDGGSVFDWLSHVAGHSHARRAVLALGGPLVLGALRSGHYADDAKERLFQALLAGRDLIDVSERSRRFALEHLSERSRPGIVARLAWHLDQGHDVVVVSASPQLYVDVVAETLEAHGALGTRLAVDPQGRLTGRYAGKNCRGQEKLRRLDEWIRSRQYARDPEIYAYGNSRGDRRLLAGATHPFDVGKLGRLGALRRYPRFESDE
jgi:phosphatidylglycerophosphatase C